MPLKRIVLDFICEINETFWSLGEPKRHRRSKNGKEGDILTETIEIIVSKIKNKINKEKYCVFGFCSVS